jgi:hypothetical protein
MGIGAPVSWDDDAAKVMIIRVGEAPIWWGRLRASTRSRARVRIGAPDRSLTGVSGMVAVTELVEQLGVIALLDAAIGPIKARDRGLGAGQLLVGMAAAQLAGQDHLVGLDRHRADAAGQRLTPVPGLGSTTAGGLARRMNPGQWAAVEHGVAAVTNTLLSRLPPQRVRALLDAATIDLDTTDVEVYGRKKRGWPTTTRANAAGARMERVGRRPG